LKCVSQKLLKQGGPIGGPTQNDFEEHEEAATKIQAQYRGKTARDKSPERVGAATKIQAQRRGQAARREDMEKKAAATRIQAQYRGKTARDKSPERVGAATKIQAQRRGQAQRRERAEKDAAAIKIQSIHRGKMSRSSSPSPPVSPTRMNADIERIEAATKIQAMQRGRVSRGSSPEPVDTSDLPSSDIRTGSPRRAGSPSKMLYLEDTVPDHADFESGSVKLVSNPLSPRSRERIRVEMLDDEAAAVKIQAMQRGKTTRDTSPMSPRSKVRQERTEAATKIQAIERGKRVRSASPERSTLRPPASSRWLRLEQWRLSSLVYSETLEMRPAYLKESEFLSECESRCDAEGWGGFTYNRSEDTAYFHKSSGDEIKEGACKSEQDETVLAYKVESHTTVSRAEDTLKSIEDKDAASSIPEGMLSPRSNVISGNISVDDFLGIKSVEKEKQPPSKDFTNDPGTEFGGLDVVAFLHGLSN